MALETQVEVFISSYPKQIEELMMSKCLFVLVLSWYTHEALSIKFGCSSVYLYIYFYIILHMLSHIHSFNTHYWMYWIRSSPCQGLQHQSSFTSNKNSSVQGAQSIRHCTDQVCSKSWRWLWWFLKDLWLGFALDKSYDCLWRLFRCRVHVFHERLDVNLWVHAHSMGDGGVFLECLSF